MDGYWRDENEPLIVKDANMQNILLEDICGYFLKY